MRLLARILLNILVLLVMSEYVAGITVDGVYSATIAVVVLSILNAVVRPVLFILTLPVTIITLGLFTFVINAGLFLFAASFLQGFTVDGFWIALLGSLILCVSSIVGGRWIK